MRCDVCQDTGFASRNGNLGGPADLAGVHHGTSECTCGAGGSELACHAMDCDSVPCPFDQLLVTEDA